MNTTRTFEHDGKKYKLTFNPKESEPVQRFDMEIQNPFKAEARASINRKGTKAGFQEKVNGYNAINVSEEAAEWMRKQKEEYRNNQPEIKTVKVVENWGETVREIEVSEEDKEEAVQEIIDQTEEQNREDAEQIFEEKVKETEEDKNQNAENEEDKEEGWNPKDLSKVKGAGETEGNHIAEALAAEQSSGRGRY